MRLPIALIALCLSTCGTSIGQEAAPRPLLIENLSTKAVRSEDSHGWTCRVRFTTSVPAVPLLQWGTDETCPNTASPLALWDVKPDETMRNHRFDLPGLSLDAPVFVRVTVTDADGRQAQTDVTRVAPPAQFPRGSVERQTIPLTVTETEGVDREEPVSFGIPLPEGAIGSSYMAALVDGGTQVPTSGRALLRWPDGSIKWLLVSGRVKVGASETKSLQLAIGTKVQGEVGKHPYPVLTREAERLVVGMGPARFAIGTTDGVGTLQTRVRRITRTPVSVLTTVEGEKLTGVVEAVEVEEDTRERVVIRVSGHHVTATGEPYYGFELRYFCHAGDPFVRVDHILKHDIVSPAMQYGDEMKSFASLDLVFSPSAAGGEGAAQVAVEGGSLSQLPEGQRLFQHSDTACLLGEAESGRCPGLLTRGGFSVAVRDFWQNWPKALSAPAEGLTVGLYPTITPPDRYSNQPNEWLLHYYIRDGVYTFRSGFQKRHELLMGPSGAATPAQLLARVNAPLIVSAPASWYADSGALLDITADDPEEFALYDELMDQGVDLYFDAVEQNHWYGLMNYGDTPGGRPYSWRNIEYDTQHGLLSQYFRTGDRRFFIAAERAARHNADVDVVHHAAGQKCGAGGPRRVGQAWVHCMGHTGGYYPSNHLDMSIYACGYCENEGHMWAQGNWEYSLLTGDEQVRRAAQQLADWGSGPNTVNFRYGNARVPGWMGIIAMSSYFATGDEYYLNGMRLMYEVVKELGDERYGLWVHPLSGGHCDCEVKHSGEAGFMAGVLMTALKYLYLATGDEEVAERIVRTARFTIDTMWDEQEGAFHYTSCPKTGISPILTMLTANGQAFAANYSGDSRMMDLMRKAFARGLAAFQGGGAGNQVMYGLPIASAPEAIAEISRFEGIGFAEYSRAMLAAALSPARRPVPALVPNPDFEQTGDGWRTRPELTYEITTELSHTGAACAKASGKIAGQGEYLVTWYACGAPWEIVWLEPGRRYRAQMWLRVDRLGEGIPAPKPRIAFRSKGTTRDSVSTNPYDLSRMGEWQRLSCDFEVPEYYDALYIAVSTGTREPQEDVLMCLDDIAIVPAELPERDAYVYPTGDAAQARLSGGLALQPDEFTTTWQTISAPEQKAGRAVFSITVPLDDTYRLFARGMGRGAEARVGIAIDGRDAGELAVSASTNHQWMELPGATALSAGDHEVTLTWPAGCAAVIQKLCLTNEPAM